MYANLFQSRSKDQDANLFQPSSNDQDEKSIPREVIVIDSDIFLEFQKILRNHGSLIGYFNEKNIRISSFSAKEVYYYHMDNGVFEKGKFDETGDKRKEISMTERVFFGLKGIHEKGDLEGKNIFERTASPHPHCYHRFEGGKLQDGYFKEEQGNIQRPAIVNGPK